MMQRNEQRPPRIPPVSPKDLLEFRPWMLALAVFLACAIGIAIMEQVPDPRAVFAQASPQDGAQAPRAP
ncbi:hypothetical protein [Anaeromyxobacter oryzae]|nr:hypothetical protein [Anaeromyxobacter oryzae]